MADVRPRTGAGLRAGSGLPRPARRRRLPAGARAGDHLLPGAVDRPRAGIRRDRRGMRRSAASPSRRSRSTMRPQLSPAAIADRTLVWTLTDGIAYFRGGAAPALARLERLADHRLRRFAVCALPGQVPRRRGAAGARPAVAANAGWRATGEWLVEPPAFARRLVRQAEPAGLEDRHLAGFALPRSRPCAGAQPPRLRRLSRRVVVQPYVAGRNVRASFLAVEPRGRRGAAGRLLRRFRRRLPDHGRQPGALRRDRRGGEGEGKYEEPKLVAVADDAAGCGRRRSGASPRC